MHAERDWLNRVVSASEDCSLKRWDLEEGRELRTYHGHTDRVNCVRVSPDELEIISGSWDFAQTLGSRPGPDSGDPAGPMECGIRQR